MSILKSISSCKNENKLDKPETNAPEIEGNFEKKEDLPITDDETTTKCEKIPNKEESLVATPKRKTICVSKLGSDHKFANKNNQDFSFNLLNMKIVSDGCGSGKHSEVGTHLFAQLFARKVKEFYNEGKIISEENIVEVIQNIFKKMLNLCNDINFIFENYCFTLLICFEFENEFVVYSCGDGYIIKETLEGITFEELDDGEYPCYYIYNFIEDKDTLTAYKNGVEFKVNRYSKEEYINVGVASDGLRFCENLLDLEKNKLMKFLHEGKGSQIEMLINRNNNKNEMFHDDISICF